MDLNYITENDKAITERFISQGYDVDALILLCSEMINLSDDLNLQIGDLRDFIYRMKNRQDFINGKTPEPKIKCEDACPMKITFQPQGMIKIFNFTRSTGMADVPYKEATFFCDLCGPEIKFHKKEIKVHVNSTHRNF